ncbi:MAG: hypothetical protein A4S09_05150 [Proteobacteria bacterium SG_bin7]|nr:MAG: hypothetical protein A4S09_05150 [Proteobacteria bacterium SG_bin7]
MAKYIYFLATLVLCNSNALAFQCGDLFSPASALSNLFSNQELTDIFGKFATSNYGRFVEAIGSVQTPDGPAVVFKRVSYRPNSRYRPTTLTIKGNPIAAVAILGPKLARIFGYRKISETEFYVPTPERINFVIREINSLLVKKGLEPIEFNFYDDGRPETPVDDLISRFADTLGFPLTTNSPLTVHDYAFHVVAFLIPNKVFALARRQSQMVKKFIDFLEKKRQNINNDKELDFFITEVKAARAIDTDIGTGNLTPLLLRKNYDKDYWSILSEIYYHLVHRGASPKKYLVDVVKSSLPWSKIRELLKLKKTFRSTILELLEEFNESQESSQFEQSLTNADGSKYVEKDYLRDIEQRLKDIQDLFP